MILSYKNENILKFLLVAIFITVIPLTGDDARNYLLIGVMGIATFLTVSIILRNGFLKAELPLLSFIVVLILSTVVTTSYRNSWSSTFYTCMFISFLILIMRNVRKTRFEIREYKKIISFIIKAYFVVIVIQQFCFLTGIPIFNGISNINGDLFRLNSLSPEPSHTVRYMGILMFSYIFMQRIERDNQITLKQSFKESKNVWLTFLYVMVSSASGTGVFILIIIFSCFISFRNSIIVLLFAGVASLFVSSTEVVSLNRAVNFSEAVLTGNKEKMMIADHSASYRIVPAMIALEEMNLTSIDGWIGKGSGYMSLILYKRMPGIPKGDSGGGLATFFLERGLILGVFFLLISFGIGYNSKYKLQSLLLWFFCVASVSINMQITWAFLILSSINKYLYEAKSIRK